MTMGFNCTKPMGVHQLGPVTCDVSSVFFTFWVVQNIVLSLGHISLIGTSLNYLEPKTQKPAEK